MFYAKSSLQSKWLLYFIEQTKRETGEFQLRYNFLEISIYCLLACRTYARICYL